MIAFPEGAAAEVVIDGENGMLVSGEAEMARAVERIGSIDPVRCRSSVLERFDLPVTASRYERVYRGAIGTPAGRHGRPRTPAVRIAAPRIGVRR